MAVTIKGNNQPLTYTVLTRVRSESGSWEYEIRTSHKTGITYCSCKGWAFNKTCKHLNAWKQNPTVAAVEATMLPQKPVRLSPGEVLRDELSALGLVISQASANAISARVLAAGGKTAGVSAPSKHINADNVRVIILPD